MKDKDERIVADRLELQLRDITKHYHDALRRYNSEPSADNKVKVDVLGDTIRSHRKKLLEIAGGVEESATEQSEPVVEDEDELKKIANMIKVLNRDYKEMIREYRDCRDRMKELSHEKKKARDRLAKLREWKKELSKGVTK